MLIDSHEVVPASGGEQNVQIIEDKQSILVLGDDVAADYWLNEVGLGK